jgi:hypothetical protein
MAVSMNSSMKHCAVCAYWGGSREISSNNHGVRVDSAHIEGNCMNLKSPYKKKETHADSKCMKFEKWQVLK